MLVKTILNQCSKYKSFVYGDVKFTNVSESKIIEVDIQLRKNSKAICSGCQNPAPGYDSQSSARRFDFIPIWGFPVIFIYTMRRVCCQECGVKVEEVPWAKGKSSLTQTYMQFLANWCKSLSWSETAKRFNTSWDKVYSSVEYVVSWGLENRSLKGITAIGVDEVAWKKGHKYLTVVYQINKSCVRLLWINKDRTKKNFSKFFDKLGEDKCQVIEFVCSDMWKPYLKVIKERIGGAIHILDRFHIVANLNKALDKVRSEEHKQMKRDGYDPLLTHARWALLKCPENLTPKQEIKLKDIMKYNLKSIRAYFLKEQFQQLWRYVSPLWAGKFIDRWSTQVMRSKIEPMKVQAKSIRKHKYLILNYFRAKKAFSSGVVEGLNNKIKLTMRKSYGFREYKSIKITLFHALRKLPEPPFTHRFF